MADNNGGLLSGYDPYGGGGLLNPNMQGWLAAAAAMLAASGPSRVPISTGQAMGQALLGGLQARQQAAQNQAELQLMGQQYRGQLNQNALGDMTVQGYRSLQPPTAQGGIAGSMNPGLLSGVNTSQPGWYLREQNQPALAGAGLLSGGGSPAPANPAAAAAGPTATLLNSPPGTSMMLPGAHGALTEHVVTDGSGNVPPGGEQLTIEDLKPQTTGLTQLVNGPQPGGPAPLFDLPSLVSRYQIYARTPGMQGLAQQTLSLIQKGLPEGAQFLSDGSIALRPGADQVYAGKALAEKGYLQGPDGAYRFAPGYVQGQAQLAGAQEWAKVAPQLAEKNAEPYTLTRPGSVRIINGRVVAQNPQQVSGVNPDGQPYQTYIMPPTQAQGGSLLNPSSAVAPAPGGLLSGNPSSSLMVPQIGAAFGGPRANAAGGVTMNAQGMPQWQTGLSPLQESSAKARGTQLEDYGQKLQTDATGAVNQQFLIDQLRRESGNGAGWEPGRFAEWGGAFRSMMQGVLGDKMSSDDLKTALGNYQGFSKNAMQLVTTATRAVSSRAAVQEMQMIRGALPGAQMSSTGLRYIFDQLSANSDFMVAKNQAAETWRGGHGGTLAGFESAWNQSLSPFAFLAHRMSNDDYQAMTSNLGKTPEGRVLLGKIIAETKTAASLGLIQDGPQ